MTMTHLSDEQMTEWLLGAVDDQVRQHLAVCEGCRAEVDRVRGAIGGYARTTREQAEAWAMRPFAAPARHSFTPRFAWVASLAVVVIAVVLLVTTPAPRQQVVEGQDADDALLMSIQQDLNREVPQALAPAAMLARERNRVIVGVQNERRNR